MLSFAVYSNGQPARKVNLAGAYLVGPDDVAVRAEISFKNGVITCEKQTAGPAGLTLLWEVPGAGAIMLDTIRVPERDKPYTLQVELARARLSRIGQKIEDWGLLDHGGASACLQAVQQGREALIRALQADTPAESAAIGDEALALSVRASEELSRFHAEALLQRRRQLGGFPRHVLGCSIPLDQSTEALRKRLAAAVDFVTVPIVWRDLEPSEQTFSWKPLDAWVEFLAQEHIAMKGSALLSFHEKHVPDWLYVWEHDFDAIRDLAFEYVRRVLNRYGQYIHTWDVISGIHANNCFTFSFEQLIELTRMAAGLTKQMSPRSVAIIDVVAPWGEYYARNQRTVPPLLYADMALQSGVNFDAFGLQLYFGSSVDGMFVRDMFQISSLLDIFAKLGKPLHITAVQVPSDTQIPQPANAPAAAAGGGFWREPWNEQVQSEWLRQFLVVALSKPFVETVSWDHLADHRRQTVPTGGLLRPDLTPKAAYNQFVKTRSELLRDGKRGSRGPTG